MVLVFDMKIRVRAFAAIRELLGRDAFELEVANDATPASVLRELLGERADIATIERSTLFAVNREYVDSGSSLNEGDELSLLPPVAGGSG